MTGDSPHNGEPGAGVSRADLVRYARTGNKRERVRARAVRRVALDGEPVDVVALDLRKTTVAIRAWLDAAKRQGIEGLLSPQRLGRPRRLNWADADRILTEFRRGSSARSIASSTGIGRSTVARLVDTLGLSDKDEALLSESLSKVASRVRAILAFCLVADGLLMVVAAGDGPHDPPPQLRRRTLRDRPEHQRAERVLGKLIGQVEGSAPATSEALARLLRLPECDLAAHRQIYSIFALSESPAVTNIKQGYYSVDPPEWLAFVAKVLRMLNRRRDPQADRLSRELNALASDANDERSAGLVMAARGLL